MLDTSGPATVLTIVHPVVVYRGEIEGEPWAFRWDEVQIPESPFGKFQYAIEFNTGGGWSSFNHFWKEDPDNIPSSGQRRPVLVLQPHKQVEIRLRTLAWSGTVEEARRTPRKQLEPFFASEVPGVRDGAHSLLRHIGADLPPSHRKGS